MNTLQPSPAYPRLRVFIVENHADTMAALGGYLTQSGHHVDYARSLTEAMKTLPGAECDVLISDIGLPDGNGWELLERVNLPPTVYCVAMSGFGLNVDRAKSQAAGYRHHLLKPFDPEELDNILEEAARERFSAG